MRFVQCAWERGVLKEGGGDRVEEVGVHHRGTEPRREAAINVAIDQSRDTARGLAVRVPTEEHFNGARCAPCCLCRSAPTYLKPNPCFVVTSKKPAAGRKIYQSPRRTCDERASRITTSFTSTTAGVRMYRTYTIAPALYAQFFFLWEKNAGLLGLLPRPPGTRNRPSNRAGGHTVALVAAATHIL